MTEPWFVDSPPALAELCDRLRRCDWVALDTEFIRERTYYPQLCLLQLATDDLVACVDPLAGLDLAPLFDRLYEPALTKVLHAAQQDLEILSRLRGMPPAPLFDTQIAATVLGHGEQIGYAALVEAVLGVGLDKSQVRTDWSRRPLSAEQLRYAADDVIYLGVIYRHQRAELEARGRLTWLAEDFAALADAARYRIDPEQSWRRIKGANKLRGRRLNVLRALAAWRERTAMATDRPRRWLLGDDVLLDLARLLPADAEALSRLRGLSDERRRRYGDTLLELIATASAEPPERWPALPAGKPLALPQEALVDALLAIVRLAAQEHEVSPGSLASRRDLEQLVQGQDAAVLHGWRRVLAGQRISEFLAGQRMLAVSAGELVLTEMSDARLHSAGCQ